MAVTHRPPLAVAAAALALAPGCFMFTTKHEGKELRRDLSHVENRLAKKESDLNAQIERLDQTLDQATKLLTRNSADIGADLQGLRDDNARLTGMVMDARRDLDAMRAELKDRQTQGEARVAEIEARLAEIEQKADAPRSPGEQWAEAKAAFDAGDHTKARLGFSRLVRGWPSDDLADDALYYWAESYVAQEDYEKAMATYQKIFDTSSRYRTGELADKALYRAGQAAEKLKWCTDARAYYGFLRQNYSKSEYLQKAAQRDKILKRDAKNAKRCKS